MDEPNAPIPPDPQRPIADGGPLQPAPDHAEERFAAVPANSGMADVVVIHLSADHESALAQILQRATAMPVMQVHQTTRTEPNHVYVIPPGKTLAPANGHLTCGDGALVAASSGRKQGATFIELPS